MRAAIRVAAGRAARVSGPVAALVQGVIRAMFFAKLKAAAAMLSALMLVSLLMISSLAGPAHSQIEKVVAKDRAVATVDEPKTKGQVPDVVVATVKRTRLERTTGQPGTLIADQSVDLYARVPGYLSKSAVDIGSRVHRGDVLAELYDPEAPRSAYRVVGGRAARAGISVGSDDGQRAEVLEGLKEGDIVIANPDARMHDGQAVAIRKDCAGTGYPMSRARREIPLGIHTVTDALWRST